MITRSSINHHKSSSTARFLQHAHAAEPYAAQVFTIPDYHRVCASYRALTTYEAFVPDYNPHQWQDVTYIENLLKSLNNINSITDLEQRHYLLTYWRDTVTLYFHDPSINPIESFRNSLHPQALFCATQICSSITPQIFEGILTQSPHPFAAEQLSSYLEFQETVKVLALGFIIGLMKPTEPLS